MKHYDLIIIGAGIIGWTVAYNLSQRFPDLNIAILEKESSLCQHQTGRNSGVIHSGIYYKPGSLKALLCREGREMLFKFCKEHQVHYDLCGKLLVAMDEKELTGLRKLESRGRENGLKGLKQLCSKESQKIEPYLRAVKSLWVPECGIIHYPDVVQAIALHLSSKKQDLHLDHRVVGIESVNNRYHITTQKDQFSAEYLINCAGLQSDHIARMIIPKSEMPGQIIPFRGEYYELVPHRRNLVKGLIYPVPDPSLPFLGVHLTKRIDQSVEAGPNAVLALAREGYVASHINLKDCVRLAQFSGFWKVGLKYWKTGGYEYARSLSKKLFLKDLQKFIPSLQLSDLGEKKAGVRAQFVSNEGKLLDDFCLQKRGKMLHVLNAPSPAATASFAISKKIVSSLFDSVEASSYSPVEL